MKNDLISRSSAIEAIEKHIRTAEEPYQLTDADKVMNHAFEIAASCVYNLSAAQPKTHDKRTESHACDSISRQAAINEIMALIEEPDNDFNEGVRTSACVIDKLPSAQPERKKGKWIAVTEDGDVYKRICSCCGREAFFQNDDPDELYDGGRYELSDFCPHCGADMKEDDHE